MDNRRQTYRHAFDPEEALHIEAVFRSPRLTLPGRAVNLSITGLLGLFAPAFASVKLEQMLTVRLLGGSSTPPVNLELATPGRIKHIEHTTDGVLLGILFSPLANPVTDAQRERALGRFLMQEQRRQRRKKVIEILPGAEGLALTPAPLQPDNESPGHAPRPARRPRP